MAHDKNMNADKNIKQDVRVRTEGPIRGKKLNGKKLKNIKVYFNFFRNFLRFFRSFASSSLSKGGRTSSSEYT